MSSFVPSLSPPPARLRQFRLVIIREVPVSITARAFLADNRNITSGLPVIQEQSGKSRSTSRLFGTNRRSKNGNRLKLRSNAAY